MMLVLNVMNKIPHYCSAITILNNVVNS